MIGKRFLRARSPERPFPLVYCAYETQPTYTQIIVPWTSSQQGCDAAPAAFDLNHANIVKPTSDNDDIYVYARSRIKKSFDMGIIKQKVSIEILRDNGTRLGAGEFLKSGDQYSISLKAEQPAWFYVFVKDSADIVQRYYPLSARPQRNATKVLRVPDEREYYIRLDDIIGAESIFVFALTSQSAELAQEATEIGLDTPTMGLSIASEKNLTSEVKKRGGSFQKIKPNLNGVNTIPTYLNDAAAIYTIDHRK